MEPFLNPAQTVVDLRSGVTALRDNIWGQHRSYDKSSGALCAFGALRVGIGGIVLDDKYEFGFTEMDNVPYIKHLYGVGAFEVTCAMRLRDRASNAARAFYRIIGSDIVVYNDTKGRTKHEMIRAMETVAAAIEENPRRA